MSYAVHAFCDACGAPKSNLEKARECIKDAENCAWAPPQAAYYTGAIAYLLLEHLEREDGK